MISDLLSFRDRKYLVTGGSRGIGLAVVKRLLAEGAKVWIASRSAPVDLDGAFVHIPCDLTLAEGREQVVHALDGVVLDGAVLNAGACSRLMPFPLVPETEMRAMLELNFLSPALLLQRLWRKKRLASESSVVINGAAAAGFSPQASFAYVASKAALHAGLVSAARDLVTRGLRINIVDLGYVDTDLIDGLALNIQDFRDAGKVLTVEQAVGPLIYPLTRAARWMTGTRLVASAGIHLTTVPNR